MKILDTLPEKIFDNITALASQICGTPIALVSLVDADRQWFKSHHGLDATETPRDVSFCGHAIAAGDGVFQVSNSFADERFRDNPLVTGDPRVVFYAGAPLVTGDGQKVGTLCVIDHKPHALTEPQTESLRRLADQVIALFELRTETARLSETEQYLATTLRSVGDAVIATTSGAEPKVSFLNSVAEELTGWSSEEASGRPVHEVFNIINVKTNEPALDPVARVLREGRAVGLANHTALISKSGARFIIEDSAAPIRDFDGRTSGVVLVFRDVTDKIALEEKSLLLNAVVESSKDFIAIASADGQAFYVNPAGRRLVGLSSAGDVTKTKIVDYFAESEKARIAEDAVPRILKEGSWDGRVLFKKFQTEEEIPFSWNAFTIADVETGGIAAIACVSKDLRDSEKRQLIADTEQAKLISLLSQMPVGVCLLEGPEHRYAFANPCFYDLFRGDRGILGRSLSEASPELRRTQLPRILDWVYQTGTPFYGSEFPVDVADGVGGLHSLFLNFALEPMRDPSGAIYGISVTAAEVTELVRSRKVLEQKDARLSLALNAGKIGTWDFDLATKELMWSERGAEMCGFSGAAKTGYDDFLSRVHPEDRERMRASVLASTSENGSAAYEIEYRILRPDGETRTIQANGMTEFESVGGALKPVLFTGTVIDVTDQVNARAQILAAKNLAETANTAKSAFLANMSHEIRSPLGSIMGFSDLLKSGDVSLADVSQYVSVIDRNSQHLLRIIDDILDLAKVEAGKMTIEHVDFSLHDLLADFSSLMGFKARDKGIEFKLRVPSLIPSVINSDPTRLRQILTNVVGNAIKFTDQGRVQLNVTVENSVARFSVSDTGPGITPEQADKLFQPFHQADVSTTRKFGGTGLGLVLTRRLTEILGGSFVLQKSAPGQGSVFVAKIRIGVPNAARMIEGGEDRSFDVPPKASADPQINFVLNGVRILVVDDAPDNQALFKLILKKAGATIDVATNGFEGMNMALTNSYDVVLMDVQMPMMDGHQATQRLRARGYDVPIIALTAHAMVEERERASNSGFTDFISKPVHRDTLIAMLQRYASAG